MANHARIENGIVVEIINDGGKDITKLFHASIVSALVPEKAGMVIGGTWDGANFGQPTVPVVIPPTPAERQAAIDETIANSEPLRLILEAIEDAQGPEREINSRCKSKG